MAFCEISLLSLYLSQVPLNSVLHSDFTTSICKIPEWEQSTWIKSPTSNHMVQFIHRSERSWTPEVNTRMNGAREAPAQTAQSSSPHPAEQFWMCQNVTPGFPGEASTGTRYCTSSALRSPFLHFNISEVRCIFQMMAGHNLLGSFFSPLMGHKRILYLAISVLRFDKIILISLHLLISSLFLKIVWVNFTIKDTFALKPFEQEELESAWGKDRSRTLGLSCCDHAEHLTAVTLSLPEWWGGGETLGLTGDTQSQTRTELKELLNS